MFLKTFGSFAGKHLCWRVFLIKLQAGRPATLLKRDSQKSVFQEISDICKNTYVKEPPQGTDSAIYQFYRYAINTKLLQLVENIFLLKVLQLLLTYHDKYFLFLVIRKSIIVLMKRSVLT